MNAVIAEHIAGFKIAKSHGRGDHHHAIFTHLTHAISRHFVETNLSFSSSRAFFEFATSVALVAFLYAATALFGLPASQLVVIAFVFTRLMPRIATIQSNWQRLLQYQDSYEAVVKMQNALDEAAEPEQPALLEPVTLEQEVRLIDVSFHYDLHGGQAAVEGVNFRIPARQTTALVGRSGAGKSTIADLVLGLLSPTGGRVLVDGAPLEDALLQRWRKAIGYVPQEPFLFHETIRANLLWAKPDATTEDLQAVLRTAAAEDFISRLPNGLDSVVGDRGVRLSGGERQRLTLARALLRKPTLLLLDEATSSLDNENERSVKDAIDLLHGELTIVVIAHRLSTVQTADQVVVLADGRVVETGSPREMFRREDGVFRKMMHLDSLDT